MALQRSSLLFESFFQNVEWRRLEKVVAMPIDADGDLVPGWPKRILSTQREAIPPEHFYLAVDERVGSSELLYRKAACCHFRSPV